MKGIAHAFAINHSAVSNVLFRLKERAQKDSSVLREISILRERLIGQSGD